MLTPEEQGKAVKEFISSHARPYDPATDDYERHPFSADIKEGKNDPIYNAHSYHTKVPPRSIIPYILHYTKPGELILDPFCGSGMTGVAAQMCASPPADLLLQFPELKDHVGPRACILNDLSPAACHIAYNYNTPVDVEALRREFVRIKAAVKGEFDWLYGTEHYEPAVGLYAPTNPDVASRLKNPPDGSPHTLLGDENRTWELLTKSDVEARLGYPVSELPSDKDWGKPELATVKQWVCIPATIQYTIWSDVFRCEGFVTIEEPTGKVSTRGKNAGKPIMAKKRVARGCGKLVSLWNATDEINEGFVCPHCNQPWTTEQATWLKTDPTFIIFSFTEIVARANKQSKSSTVVRRRPFGRLDQIRLDEINDADIPYWFPRTRLVSGEEGNRLINSGISTVDALYTKRNLRALAAVWSETVVAPTPRLCSVLQFLFTSVSVGLCSKLTRYNFGKRGNGMMAARLFLPHFQCESNVMKVVEGKFDDLTKYFTNVSPAAACCVLTLPAQSLITLPDSSVDFIFADPPFGRNIAYSELNILWEAWLGVATDVDKEAITSNARKWDNESYNKKMEAAFVEIFRLLKPGRYAMIEFNNSDPELFEAIKAAAIDAGFVIRNMLLLDKDQKTFKQVQGILRGEGTLDKDVIFNIEKPIASIGHVSIADLDLEQQLAVAVRQHLQTLPERIKAEPAKYSDEHRTTATINSMLMNTLIPRGVSVEQLNLPFIERVCGRYFRKLGLRWYLRGEAAGSGNESKTLIEEEVVIKDEIAAIEWLRQQMKSRPLLIGVLKPLWMRATGLLSAEVSQDLVLEDLLTENFWRDAETNRWREPTDEERERMNDDRSIRVLHDAERFLDGQLKRRTTDAERCEWIDILFQASRACEDNETQVVPALRGFEPGDGYRLISRLFQSILREKVPSDAYGRAEKQARVSSQRISRELDAETAALEARRTKKDGPTLFDELDHA